MITEMSKAEVIELGARNRAGYLLEQYGYTMGLAKLDGDALAALLPKGYLDELAAEAELVSAARKDKALAAEEAKGSTQNVNDLLRKAKIWRRAIVSRAQRAKRLGKKVPATLLSAGDVTGVPGVAAQLEKMLKLVEANMADLPGTNLKPVIAEGQALANAIKAIDAEQELKNLKLKTEAVRTFYYHKGLLFIGIKVVNDAGRELHAGDPTAAARYNLSILYRNSHKKKTGTKKTAAE